MINWISKLFGKNEQLEQLEPQKQTKKTAKEELLDMLDMAEMITRLKKHEGCVLHPYICPAGKLTIGIGRNVMDNPFTDEERIAVGDWQNGITKEAAHMLCRNDISKCITQLRQHVPFFDKLDKERKYALIDLCYNMGIKTLLTFKKTLANIGCGNYKIAAEQLLQSKYAKQVGDRALRIAKLIETGRWELCL